MAGLCCAANELPVFRLLVGLTGCSMCCSICCDVLMILLIGSCRHVTLVLLLGDYRVLSASVATLLPLCFSIHLLCADNSDVQVVVVHDTALTGLHLSSLNCHCCCSSAVKLCGTAASAC